MFGLFVAGLVLLNPPILDLVGGTLFGWPAAYLYFFIIWALLIAGVALISERGGQADGRDRDNAGQ
jgi:hypothetical protein